MDRSTIHVLSKRGRSQRSIARELILSRTTVARALQEPVDKRAVGRQRGSAVDVWRPQIEQWLESGLSIVRMLEIARDDPDHPYIGGRSTFSDRVRQIRDEVRRRETEVSVRFEGLPGEYLQVDWGEIRRFPFRRQPPETRYFLACRLKYSRWLWILWTKDMRQETLLRGLIACMCTLGWVPWVLVFDNMKTVTSGRDADGRPLLTPALLQLAAELRFHHEACAVARGNQKGSVESLVKWVKGNFLPARTFADDPDLSHQSDVWVHERNVRPSDATKVSPVVRLPEEAAKGGRLPASAQDYGFLYPARVSSESLIHLNGNSYSVPVSHVGTTLTVRLHRDHLAIFQNTTTAAQHQRATDGAGMRVIDPAHFEPLFRKKPRAQVMLYRQALLDLDEVAARYVSEVSCRRRDRLGSEVLAIHALLERHGKDALVHAMSRATGWDGYGAEYLEAALASPLPGRPLFDTLPGDAPGQEDVDRQLAQYEAFVTISVGGDSC